MAGCHSPCMLQLVSGKKDLHHIHKGEIGQQNKIDFFFIVKALSITRVAPVSSLSLLLPSTLLLGYTKVACRQTHPVLTLTPTPTDTHGLRSHLSHTADNTTYPQQSSNQKNSFLSPAFSLCCPDWLRTYSAHVPLCNCLIQHYTSQKPAPSEFGATSASQVLLAELFISTTTLAGRQWSASCNQQSTKQKS